jgi:metallo-beta-lactamase family protein
MKISFLGACGTVTGSCYMFNDYNNLNFLVDCGMFQGDKELRLRNFGPFPFDPAGIDFVLLTHSHIDHCGLLPKLVRDGFTGKIYSTEATKELAEIMLLDSAHIQQIDMEIINKKRKRAGNSILKPLYDENDVKRCLDCFVAEAYDGEWVTPEGADGLQIKFHDAGHILGSAFIEVNFRDLELKRWLFSGDLGKRNQPVIRDPEIIEEADVLFVESTYGNRIHKSLEDTISEFETCIKAMDNTKGKVIMPAFAVGRTQTLIYHLFRLYKLGKLPQVPVYLDSPMAIRVSNLYSKFTDLHDEEAKRIDFDKEDIFSFPNLKFTTSVEESKAINDNENPCIIISASGMCDAGRIRHHLKNNLYKPSTQVVITGFQAIGTLGRALVDGVKSVELFGYDVAVNAKISTLNGFSAHADQVEIMDWLGHFTNKDLKVFVVHGEPDSAITLTDLIKQKHETWTVYKPDWQETATVEGTGIILEQHTEEGDLKQRIDKGLSDWHTIINQIDGIVQSKSSSKEILDKAWADHFLAKLNRVARRVVRKYKDK